jgi:hypothetical protein
MASLSPAGHEFAGDLLAPGEPPEPALEFRACHHTSIGHFCPTVNSESANTPGRRFWRFSAGPPKSIGSRRRGRGDGRFRGQRLLVENDQLIPGARQLCDADRIAPKHLYSNISRIIAGTKNDDLCAGDLIQQTLEIAIR